MARPSFYVPQAENNAAPRLNSGISAGAASAVLQSGEGADLPSITTGAATSTGDETTLNDTGAFASGVTAGDIIENITDGSAAIVVEITSDDSIRTTPLEGGSDNTWENGDTWAIGVFVCTLTELDGDGEIAKQERVKVTNRVTDTLTIVRGYDGDTPQSFSAGDYCYVLVEKSTTNEARKAIANSMIRFDEIYRGTPNYIEAGGSSNAYTGTLPFKFSSYADIEGLPIVVKANHSNTGSATLNLNSKGAVTIKKKSDQNLIADDLESGMLMTLVYDGTNFKCRA